MHTRVNKAARWNREMHHINGLPPSTSLPDSESFNNDVWPVLRLLQIGGFYGKALSPPPKRTVHSSRDHLVKRLKTVCLKVYIIICILTNGVLCCFNAYVTYRLADAIGILHVFVITSLITGLLPLQNVLTLLAFNALTNRNRRLLHIISSVELRSSVETRKLARIAVIVAGFIFMVPCIARVAQCTVAPNCFSTWLNVLAFFLIPALRFWQLMPLVYFWLICHCLQGWFLQLRRMILQDVDLSIRTVSFYADCFDLLLNVSRLAGKFFGPFVLISLGFAMVNLGLSIYFITDARSILNVVIKYSGNQTEVPSAAFQQQLNLYFDIGWGFLQIVIAFIYVLVICNMGRLVNEQARQTVSAILTQNPTTLEGQFQVTKCYGKLANQLNWGVTVWRAFLVERSLLFTLISTVIAYSLVLIRLRSS